MAVYKLATHGVLLWICFQIEQNSSEEAGDLTIPVSQREDTGKYYVTAANQFGQDTATINVIVLG